jgi:replication factor A1
MRRLMLATVLVFIVSLGFLDHCALFTRVLVVIKCELVCQALDAEINGEAKKEEPPIVLKPKDECVGVTPPLAMKPKQEVKSASQIVNEQRGK